ncbi:MAG: hypothetical protein KDE31_25940, partial [Caldilineaceae bacterium]|nr:hypothetical protein [Caldilineaceae bacterium]
MRKVTPKLEWQFIENDEEWERQQALLTPIAAPRTGYRRYVQTYAGNLTVLLLLLAVGGAWWYVYQSGKAAKLSATGAIASSAQYAAATDPANATDGANANQSRSAMQLLTQGSTAGPNEQSLTTPHFIYHFGQQDEAVVRAVAPLMDTLYTILWHNLGLPIHPMPTKLVIDVALEQLPGQAVPAFAPVTVPLSTRYLMPGDPPTEPNVTASVTVPSPARYLAPVALSEVDLLAQSIALPLVAYGLAQAREQHQIGPAWQPLLDGLYLWQVWDLDLPLATWRETVVKWQYGDLLSTRPGDALPLPQHYGELCTAH